MRRGWKKDRINIKEIKNNVIGKKKIKKGRKSMNNKEKKNIKREEKVTK